MTPFQRLIKRTVDVVGAGAGLVLLSPLFALIAIAVKAESPGTVFYIDERLGLGGRRFRVVKFRSMRAGSPPRFNPDGSMLVEASDPRVTRVGRILRLGFDELPQLWNVLVGDMTLIGPRPALPREVALYDARALRRLEVEQGLTCFWQVGGRSDLTFDEQVALDLKFVDESTMRDELAILAKTVPAVITGRGAY